MNVAIVVAGGQGTRFGGNRPKQFFEINGTPIIIHSLRQFEQSRQIQRIIVVIPANEISTFHHFVDDFGLKKVASAVAGGDTRAQSVRNGLAEIEEAKVVAVHDAARPLVTSDEIDRVVTVAAETGAAILVAPVSDTIKHVQGEQIISTMARAELRRALTPQAFHFHILKRAYQDLEQLESSGVEVTDDCFLVERLNVRVSAVAGSARNIKITNREDLAIAEAILRV
jgi:2-C-methyl-D-erythritol 4-phosphate cytidylyltransferase